MGVLAKAAELHGHKTIAAITATALASGPVQASKDDAKAALEALKGYLERNDHQWSVAVMLALLLWDADSAVARLRRDGLLRASRYKFQAGAIVKATDAALAMLPTVTLRADRREFLRSVRVLLNLAPAARRLRQRLVMRLKARRRLVQKSLLVIINEAFAQGRRGGNRYLDSSIFEHWSTEEITQGLSLILHLMREEIGTVPTDWKHVDELLVSPYDSVYAELLMDAARLNELFEVETLLDGLPYKVEQHGKELKVLSIDEDLERSIRLGYIQSSVQEEIRAAGVARQFHERNQPLPTMEAFIEAAFEHGRLGEFVELRTEPIERLVFLVIQDPRFFAPIAGDQFFAEEVAVLIGLGIDNFRKSDPLSLQVTQTLTAGDILKVQRMLAFFSAVFQRKLQEIQPEERQERLRVRSVLPVIRIKDMVMTLGQVLPSAKAQEVIDILTLKVEQKFIDIQYRPLIEAADHLVVAPAMVARSNLVRNVVIANNLRSVLLDGKDPMQEAVVATLEEAGFKVRANFEFNIEGKRETDIIAWREGHIFVFECKNSFLPVSAHELRTSYEHLKTARDQLNIRLRWMKVTANQENLLKWLGWDIPATADVHTGVITANRVFNGYTMGGHPVRQAHELINVVAGGYVRLGSEQQVRFWRDESFQALDLVEYLQGGSIIQQQFDLLRPFERRLHIEDMTLTLQNYHLDMQEAVEQFQGGDGGDNHSSTD
ncbi:MAG: endonuclease [Gammaproteobacteria bacterium]|nr:endonuclease [Gammaproteobacteria bacterium]